MAVELTKVDAVMERPMAVELRFRLCCRTSIGNGRCPVCYGSQGLGKRPPPTCNFQERALDSGGRNTALKAR